MRVAAGKSLGRVRRTGRLRVEQLENRSLLSGAPALGDFFVVEQTGFPGGFIDHFNAAGQKIGEIDNPILSQNILFQSGIELGPDGTVYVAVDTEPATPPGEIVHFDTSGNLLSTTPLPGVPQGFEVDGDGTLWVALPNSNQIVHVNLQGDLLPSLLNGFPFEGPVDVAVPSPREFFIVQQQSALPLLKVDRDGNVIHVGEFGFGSPTSLDFAPDGSAWITDPSPLSLSNVYQVDFSTPFPTVKQTIRDFGATDAEVNPAGNVWVTNASHDSLQEFDASGNLLANVPVSASPQSLAVVGGDNLPPGSVLTPNPGSSAAAVQGPRADSTANELVAILGVVNRGTVTPSATAPTGAASVQLIEAPEAASSSVDGAKWSMERGASSVEVGTWKVHATHGPRPVVRHPGSAGSVDAFFVAVRSNQDEGWSL